MVSPHFPPDTTAGTHRVRLLAPHLTAFGWEPVVVSVAPDRYEGAIDPGLLSLVPQNVRVVRSSAWSFRWTRRIGIGDLGIRAYTGLRHACAGLLEHERFDAVFITMYPTYPALIGPMVKHRFRVPFVLDYQDPWVGEWGRSAGPGVDGRPDFKSRASRFIATRMEPYALKAADAVTAVSHATYEQALERTPEAKPRATAELPIGWDRRDLEFVGNGAGRIAMFPDDGLVHLSYVGTLLPTGIDTLRAVLAAVAALRASSPAAARLRLHFFGTSNQRTSDAPTRVMPVAAAYGLLDVVTESAPRLDYFEALRVLRDSTAVLLMGSSERHYTPSKVFPALVAERPVVAVLHAASSASDLLHRIGRAPTVRLITYDDRTAQTEVDAIAAQLSALIAEPRYVADAVDQRVLELASACSLAGRLANVLDQCLR